MCVCDASVWLCVVVLFVLNMFTLILFLTWKQAFYRFNFVTGCLVKRTFLSIEILMYYSNCSCSIFRDDFFFPYL